MQWRLTWRCACAAILFAAGALQATPRLLSELTINEERRFGGLSGIHIAPDGPSYFLTDSAILWSANILRDETGQAVRIVPKRRYVLRDRRRRWLIGIPVELGKVLNDSEGLDMGPSGELLVSFEGFDRVMETARPSGVLKMLPRHPYWTDFGANSGFESVAYGPDGAIYALAERPAGHEADIALYCFQDGKWEIAARIAYEAPYAPVEIDFDDQGRLYILERGFSAVFGFSTRLRRGIGGFDSFETLLETPYRRFGNLEGVSLWRDTQGRLIASMVSDNNFSHFLRAELVEYILED